MNSCFPNIGPHEFFHPHLEQHDVQVLMDLVHAHASSNTLDGIAQFGSPGLESENPMTKPSVVMSKAAKSKGFMMSC